mmetsp:Transcript_19/g.6  ORF Transcript_19/g.6 Transcript_19/m.6 type:complete len:112 (+) Transcript_19:1558-1893(+)
MVRKHTVSICFPFNSFRYSLTLFSKFFASFLHSTCALSVSYLYLALHGVYHAFELQSQATRLVEGMCYDRRSQARTGVSPSQLLFSKRLSPEPRPTMLLQTTTRQKIADYR